MNFSLFRVLRFLLFPFSLVYGLIVTARNFLFDKKIIKSVSFDLPIIAVGNLSVGGTGKTPMVEYLVTLLRNKYKIATLSRGYKRKTKGFLLAQANTKAQDIGDEPMQFHLKFPDIAVVVGEERIIAIPQLLQQRPETNVIILDDALQHRSIKPGFNILLTDRSHLFTQDYYLPTGNLRDQLSSYKRADIIIVTKCPQALTEQQGELIKKDIRPLPHQKVFFTAIDYGEPYHIITKQEKVITVDDEVLLVCGIANPLPLKNYLSQKVKRCSLLPFSDHHVYTKRDIKEIKQRFSSIATHRKIIVTTEKDAVRLVEFNDELTNMPLFIIPIEHKFLFGQGIQFDYLVNTFIEMFPGDKK